MAGIHFNSSVINLKNVSHNIREIHWDGNDLMGTVEILPTPSGNILKELLKAGILLGISSRGMGSVSQRRGGGVEVGEDFELIGWDFVSNPSTHGAFMTPMNESKQIKVDEVCGNYCKAHDLIKTDTFANQERKRAILEKDPLVCSKHLSSWTGIGRSGHVQSQSFRSISHVSDPKLTF